MRYSKLHTNTEIFGPKTIFREVQKKSCSWYKIPHVWHNAQSDLKMSNME